MNCQTMFFERLLHPVRSERVEKAEAKISGERCESVPQAVLGQSQLV
jgi:hypothetical protein